MITIDYPTLRWHLDHIRGKREYQAVFMHTELLPSGQMRSTDGFHLAVSENAVTGLEQPLLIRPVGNGTLPRKRKDERKIVAELDSAKNVIRHCGQEYPITYGPVGMTMPDFSRVMFSPEDTPEKTDVIDFNFIHVAKVLNQSPPALDYNGEDPNDTEFRPLVRPYRYRGVTGYAGQRSYVWHEYGHYYQMAGYTELWHNRKNS